MPASLEKAAVATGLEKLVFIPIPKKGSARERSNYRTVARIVICPVKGISLVKRAEINVFLEFPCFFYDPTEVGNLFFSSSAFVSPAYTTGSSQLRYC